MVIPEVLFWFGLITFLGYFFQYLFKKFMIPDIVLLMILGFVLGPYGFKVFNVEESVYIDIFIVFALVFNIFDGSFNLNIRTIFAQMGRSMIIANASYFLSAAVTALISFIIFRNLAISLFIGFLLGGISSSFVIPLLKNLDFVPNSVYTILVLEGAITDVFTVIFSLTVVDVARSSVNLASAFSNIIILFSIGIFMGFFGALIWIFIVHSVFKSKDNFILTIGYLFLLYAITEFVGGNGVLASLFFGITLRNAKRIFLATSTLVNKDVDENYFELTAQDKYIYDQISFLIKTFFFVYMGLAFTINKYTLWGAVTAILLMILRWFTVNKISSDPFMASTFGRGIAAAAIAKIAMSAGVISLDVMGFIYSIIMSTILLSAIEFFIVTEYVKRKIKEAKPRKQPQKVVITTKQTSTKTPSAINIKANPINDGMIKRN